MFIAFLWLMESWLGLEIVSSVKKLCQNKGKGWIICVPDRLSYSCKGRREPSMEL